MTCQHCGKEIENGSQFCLYCGQKVEVTYKCVSCGNVIHEGDAFCMSCGWKVNLSEIAAAKAAEDERKRKEAEIAAAKAVEDERKRKEVEIAAAKAVEDERKRKEVEIAAAKQKKRKNYIVWIVLGLIVIGGIFTAISKEEENSSDNSYAQNETIKEEIIEQSVEPDIVLDDEDSQSASSNIVLDDEENQNDSSDIVSDEKDTLSDPSEDGSCWSFTGLIDNKYPITGELSYSWRFGHSGSYYYDKNGPERKLYLSSGEIDGKNVFFEQTQDGIHTATFICEEHDKPMTYIKGTFVVEKTGKMSPFELTLTAKEQSDSEDIMEDE